MCSSSRWTLGRRRSCGGRHFSSPPACAWPLAWPRTYWPGGLGLVRRRAGRVPADRRDLGLAIRVGIGLLIERSAGGWYGKFPLTFDMALIGAAGGALVGIAVWLAMAAGKGRVPAT